MKAADWSRWWRRWLPRAAIAGMIAWTGSLAFLVASGYDPNEMTSGSQGVALGVLIMSTYLWSVPTAITLVRPAPLRRLRGAIGPAPRSHFSPRPHHATRMHVDPIGTNDGQKYEVVAPTSVMRDGRLVPGEPDETPRIELSAASGGYRASSARVPRLVGPGHVNGIQVGDGEQTPLQSGDVVRIGGQRLRVELPGTATVLRYHRIEGSEVRLFRPTIFPGLRVIFIIAAGMAAFVAPYAFLLRAWDVMGGALVAFLALCAAGRWLVPAWRTRARIRLTDRTLAGRGDRAIPLELASVRAVDDGGYALRVKREDVARFLQLETVPGGATDVETRALVDAMRDEARWIAEQIEHPPTDDSSGRDA